MQTQKAKRVSLSPAALDRLEEYRPANGTYSEAVLQLAAIAALITKQITEKTA